MIFMVHIEITIICIISTNYPLFFEVSTVNLRLNKNAGGAAQMIQKRIYMFSYKCSK